MNLGRVVIPKEIRRTLHIREGYPLEIFVGKDAEIVLKKYSPLGEMGDSAGDYAQVLHRVSGHTALIADRDVIVSAAGNAARRLLLDRPVSAEVEELLNARRMVSLTEDDGAAAAALRGRTGGLSRRGDRADFERGRIDRHGRARLAERGHDAHRSEACGIGGNVFGKADGKLKIKQNKKESRLVIRRLFFRKNPIVSVLNIETATRFCNHWQGRRESNTQPTVLETVALPIELLP